MNRYLPLAILLFCGVPGVRADDAAPAKPAQPVVPGTEALSDDERARYAALLKTLAENPELKAVGEAARKAQEESRRLQQEAVKAQQAAMKSRQDAMNALRQFATARAEAIKAAGPDAVALQAKVDAARRRHFETQRSKFAPSSPKPPVAQVAPAGETK